MGDENSHHATNMRLYEKYTVHQMCHQPGIMPNYQRQPLFDYLITDFAHQLKNLKEVSPYLKSTSVNFCRNATQTGIKDVIEICQEVHEFIGWVAFLPDVLIDHEFEDAKHVAFAINLKNIFDNQTLEHYVIKKIVNNLTDVLFLPQGFDELVNVCDGINYGFMDIGRVVREGDYPFMRMLVKYGVVRPTFQKSSSYILEDYIMWLAQTDQIDSISEQWWSIVLGAKTVAQDLLAYNEKKDKGREAKLLRLQTIAYAIQILNKSKPKFQKLKQNENIVACIRLYFEAVPEPFVSLQEIEELLVSVDKIKVQHSLTSEWQHSMSRKVESFSIYRAVFPDSDFLQPRTLKHLSRCVLREILSKRGQLPLAISKLPVPQSIKNYIQIV